MREYLVNAGFDFSLRPRRSKGAVDGMERRGIPIRWIEAGDVDTVIGGLDMPV